MRAGLKKIHSASLMTLLLFLPVMLALVPTASASGHESLCLYPDGGSCDEWDIGDDQTPSSQTWINSQYDFNMVDTSQVNLTMVWAIHEFERESFGDVFDLFDLGAGSVPSRDGIPADYIRNYLGVESGGAGTPTVGQKLLSEAEGIIVDMLDSGFGAQTQATAEFTETAIVDGSPIACETDPTKDAFGAPENALQDNAFYPALCLKVTATVDLDAAAVDIDSGADIERTYRGLLIMGAEISTGFTLQSPAGHDSNFKIIPPDYAQIVSVTPAAGISLPEYASWSINSKAQPQGASDQTLAVSLRMKYKANSSTPAVAVDTSSERGVDIEIILDMRDELKSKLAVEVAIYYIDATTMESWGINLVELSSDASIPLVTADGIRLAKHNGMINDSLLKNSFPTEALAVGVNSLLEGNPVTMTEVEIEPTYKDGGMDFVHNVDATDSCDDTSTIIEPKYYCIEGGGAMNMDHPIYLTTESSGTFEFSLMNMIKDMIGNLSEDIPAANLDILDSSDLEAIFNAGLAAELDLGASFLSGFMPDGMPPTDMMLTIMLPQNPAWIAGDNGSDQIVLRDNFSGEDSTRIKLQGSSPWQWDHPITDGGKEICSMYQKTCTSLVVDFNMEDFSINEWSQTVTLTVDASIDFKFYRVEVPPAISDMLTSDEASISFDVIPADMIHLIVDMGDRMADPFSTSFDIGNESYDVEFSRDGLDSFGTSMGKIATDMIHALGDQDTGMEMDFSALEVIVDIGQIPVPNPSTVSDLTPVSISVKVPQTTFTLALDMDTKTASITTHSAVEATLANAINRVTNAFAVNTGSDGIVFDDGGKGFETEIENPGLELEQLNTTPDLTLDLKLPKGLQFNEFKSSGNNAKLSFTESGQQRLVYTFPDSGESDAVSFSFKISWWFIIGEIWAYVAIPVILITLFIYKRRQKKKRKRELKDELIAKEYSHPAFEKEVPEFAVDDGFSSEGHYNVTPDEWSKKEEVKAPPPVVQDEPQGPVMPASPYGKKGKSFEDMMGWE